MDACRKLAMCAILALSTMGCSDSNHPREEPSHVSASQACGSLFPKEAARELESLTGQAKFTEDNYAEIKRFSTGLRNSELSPEGWEERELCRLVAKVDAGGRTKRLIASVSFSWSDTEVAKSRRETNRKVSKGELTLYPFGMRAEADTDGAAVYFSCLEDSYPKSTKVLRGDLWTLNTKLTGQAGRSARITILNAAARKIARQLNCLDTANLPETFHKISDPQRSPKNG
ncbi:hypothetical protein ACH4U6_34395 [Streptomyces netropsis]|uniref:hypothetical protein n=1 Tax=Streptomyces netropsis TaxID=55404 RepID=UPI00378F4F5B